MQPRGHGNVPKRFCKHLHGTVQATRTACSLDKLGAAAVVELHKARPAQCQRIQREVHICLLLYTVELKQDGAAIR